LSRASREWRTGGTPTTDEARLIRMKAVLLPIFSYLKRSGETNGKNLFRRVVIFSLLQYVFINCLFMRIYLCSKKWNSYEQYVSVEICLIFRLYVCVYSLYIPEFCHRRCISRNYLCKSDVLLYSLVKLSFAFIGMLKHLLGSH